MRLLVVVTYRESELGRAHPLSAALADLRRDVTVDRIRLRGLDASSIAALDPSAPPRLATLVARRAEGNPFFARELFRNAAESGADGLPEGVREVIGHRLDRLGPDVTRRPGHGGGDRAAVPGRRPARRCSATIRWSRSSWRLRRAWCARIATASCAFAHALVQETLLAELSTVRRVRLHRAGRRRARGAVRRRLGDRAAPVRGGGGRRWPGGGRGARARRRRGAGGARVRDGGGALRPGDGGRPGGPRPAAAAARRRADAGGGDRDRPRGVRPGGEPGPGRRRRRCAGPRARSGGPGSAS